MHQQSLRDFISETIKKALLTELGIPSFSMAEFKSLPTEIEMADYCRSAGLPFLGLGAARVVFGLPDGNAIKISRDPRSRRQNLEEVRAFGCTNQSKLFAQILEHDPEMKWLVVERAAQTFKTNQPEPFIELFNQTVGTSLTEDNYNAFFGNLNFFHREDNLERLRGYPDGRDAIEEYRKANLSPWFQELLNVAKKCDIEKQDWKPENWGKMKDGRLALVDYGFTI